MNALAKYHMLQATATTHSHMTTLKCTSTCHQLTSPPDHSPPPATNSLPHQITAHHLPPTHLHQVTAHQVEAAAAPHQLHRLDRSQARYLACTCDIVRGREEEEGERR